MPIKKRPAGRSKKSKPPKTGNRESSLHRLREELLTMLFQKAFRFSNHPTFKLTSGLTSPYYVDCKKVTLNPHGGYLVGRLIFDRIKSLSPQGIGGLTLGADSVAQAVSIVSHLSHYPIPAFVVRKAPKNHGLASQEGSPSDGWIEGDLAPGSRVVVVDDVVTTAGSTLKAIERLTAHRCQILKVMAIVDRLEGGNEAITSLGYSFESLFTIKDLVSRIPSQS